MVRLKRAYGWLTLSVWLLMALGASVRTMNAGLACPDWPLCFGSFIPDYHPQVYFEFIHRVMAGAVSIGALALAIMTFRYRDISTAVRGAAIASLVVLAGQIVLGGLTVLWQLKEGIVASHLLLGTAFFALNLGIYLRLGEGSVPKQAYSLSSAAVGSTVILNILILGQIALGGLVASHYAALACTDFPKCNGEWIPTLQGSIGLHVMHRLGAYLVALCIFAFSLWARFRAPAPLARLARIMVTIVLVQIFIGVANVIFYTPPLIAVLHQAVGVALFSFAFRAAFFAVRAGRFQGVAFSKSSARLADQPAR
jgi:heme a synthase